MKRLDNAAARCLTIAMQRVSQLHNLSRDARARRESRMSEVLNSFQDVDNNVRT